MRALFTILILTAGLATAQANQSTKRSELIDVYISNLERIWKLNEAFPPDIYLSSLGSVLLSSQNTNDPILNAKITMASASILYTAAQASLLMGARMLRGQAQCHQVYLKYKKFSDGDRKNECTSSESNLTQKSIEESVCDNRIRACQSALATYIPHYETWASGLAHLYADSSADKGSFNVRNSIPTSIENFLFGVKKECSNTEWGKKVTQEFVAACTPFTQEIVDNIYLKRPPPPPERPGNGNFNMHTREFYTGCVNTVPHPRLPLIFQYQGKDIKGMLCEDDLLQAIAISSGTLKIKQLLLAGTLIRSVQWLHMAEEAYERSKKIDLEMQKKKLDLKSTFTFSGTPICISPMTENQTCLPFSQKLMESVGKRKELSVINFEEIGTLGSFYHSKKNVSQYELLAIERLANDMEKNRSSAHSLKYQVQGLINQANLYFNFSHEADRL